MTIATQVSPSGRRSVLLNTFLGSFVAAMNISMLIIALPAIFDGIRVYPLSPLGFTSMIWLIVSYPLALAVAIPISGRLSDMYGRGKLFTIGFLVFTLSSLLLGLAQGSGEAAAAELIVFRIMQGAGGSFMFSNSPALIMDVYPPRDRGFALGIIGISFSAGSVIGLLVGGGLAVINWRLVFLINAVVGSIGTYWSYKVVYKLSPGSSSVKVDWGGAVLLAAALVSVLTALNLGMLPYGDQPLGWGNPLVWTLLAVGAALLALLVQVERRIKEPMLRLDLFKIRQFTFGVMSAFFLFLAQGANIFVLSILLQALYLPMHGVPYSETPLLAGIYLIPNSVANALFAPIGGRLVNRLGARLVSTAGAVIAATSFELLALLPIDFNYAVFAAILFMMGAGFGLFMSPNQVSILTPVPPKDRSAASGMRASMQNVGSLTSIVVFLSLIIIGTYSTLSAALMNALVKAGLQAATAGQLSSIPPAIALFAAFLGYDPISTLASLTHTSIPPQLLAELTKPSFFPTAIAPATINGFHYAYHVAALMAFTAAVLSLLRGRERLE
ncbi:MFS transporter [Thermocladium modestius]|uniref:MFS transporter n=1 Tax=Thermocladium modestius TaxID=62609 RepID=A0A830GS27_9CREN|nr:MFS transporter [Thermocladium modestius]GGP19416.1 MFS transporter [Thermocladium modestius]